MAHALFLRRFRSNRQPRSPWSQRSYVGSFLRQLCSTTINETTSTETKQQEFLLVGSGSTVDGKIPLQRTDAALFTSEFKTTPWSFADISSGLYHCGALTGEGKVKMWGRGSGGRLGFETDSWTEKPTELDEIQSKVSKLALGGQHSMALTGDGKVLIWGFGASGQLGLGDNIEPSGPTLVEGLQGVVDVAAGGTHSLAVDDEGAVWSWGRGEHGRLGRNVYPYSDSPRAIKADVKGKPNTVVCSGFGSAIVTDEGHLYTFGPGLNGELGIGERRESCYIPLKVDLPRVKQLCAGGMHWIALTEEGVFAWGSNQWGQLGVSSDTNIHAKPTRLSEFDSQVVVHVACGANHSLIVTESGHVYAFGNNREGQLGFQSAHVSTPTRVPGIGRAQRAAAGASHSLLLLEA